MNHKTRLHLKLCIAVTVCILLTACAQRSAPDSDAEKPTGDSNNITSTVQVPVRLAVVRRETIEVTITATGHTEALRQARIRAPFASRLISLKVADGDHVKAGQVIAIVVSKNSVATLAGAEQMLATAHNEADRTDAQRAVELARSHLVQQELDASAASVVLSHTAETGDYVDESEVLVTLADADSVFFNAKVSQSDVDRVHAGQIAHIDLPAISAQPVDAIVHNRLPMASSQDFIAPVRLDFSQTSSHLDLGLFGTARIVVARHVDVTIIPVSAILRDDVSGVSRVAIIESGVAHWLTVDTGVRQGDDVEILHPSIEAGKQVITDGQVGLPEGAKITVQP